MKPTEHRIVNDFRKQYHAAKEKVEEFEALLDECETPEPARFRLKQWVEENLIAPILDIGERRIRGDQGKN